MAPDLPPYQPRPMAGPVPGPDRNPFQPRGRRRGGWLKLLLILIVVIFAVFVAPTPWALHIGGTFTPLETWSGYGAVQASNGGLYVLFTRFQGGITGGGEDGPSCSSRGCDTLFGNAQLCTRSGQAYTFSLTGAVHSWWSTDGARTSVDLTGPRLPDGWVVAFHGSWHGAALPLATPDNSFTEVFTPAGAIRTVTSTADAGVARVTLRPGSQAAFQHACQALASGH